MAISPVSYVDKYARWPKKTLLIYATYDLTFLPVYSHQLLDEFTRRGLPHRAARPALRPLHHRRNAFQVPRRLLHGVVPAVGIRLIWKGGAEVPPFRRLLKNVNRGDE